MNETNTHDKILIVDDIKTNRLFLSSLLEIENYSSIEAESGQEAINIILKDKSIKLVLLDYMMPGMSGIDTLKIIRSKYSLIDLPVIMVTALNETENIVECLNAGANDYVTKPVDISIGMARINTHFNLSKISRENKEKEQRFKTLSDLSFEGIVIHKDNLILDVNQKFASMCNHNVNYIKGKNINDFIGDNSIEKITLTGNSYKEFKIINSLGETINVEGISKEISFNNEVATVTAIKDISERINNEIMYNKLQKNITDHESTNPSFPVCSSCNKIQNGEGKWQNADTFIKEVYNTSTKECTCPSCFKEFENIENSYITIDKNTLTVKKNGEKIYLTLGEFNILSYLIDNQTRLISIDEILEKVMGYPPRTGNPDAVRTHITRLRGKIEKDPSKPEIITNIPKAGYKYNNLVSEG